MLPSAGEIVKRPHTSLTHNFQAQKNVRSQEALRATFHSSVECRARTFSRNLILVRMTPAAIVSQRR